MTGVAENNVSVERAFSMQAPAFDSIENRNEILRWMRSRVHDHCMQFFKSGESMLELNCGTGIDAIYFAEKGLQVHATDLSAGMLAELRKKISLKDLSQKISVQQCSYTELDFPEEKKFDHIFSDFGGLNCVEGIESVVAQFKIFLKPGGTVTLVVMPPVCPWELLLALKGNFKTAFRRLRKNGADSMVEGIHFTSYYFTPSRLVRAFGRDYTKLELKGLAGIVPPPYLENFPKKFPATYKRFCLWEEKMSTRFPFNCWADHFILTMKLN